jgi:hypothetical protein
MARRLTTNQEIAGSIPASIRPSLRNREESLFSPMLDSMNDICLFGGSFNFYNVVDRLDHASPATNTIGIIIKTVVLCT